MGNKLDAETAKLVARVLERMVTELWAEWEEKDVADCDEPQWFDDYLQHFRHLDNWDSTQRDVPARELAYNAIVMFLDHAAASYDDSK